jgi:glyoxylase-like metal-dependent hydrolase (beta-lactamase superfamily II)
VAYFKVRGLGAGIFSIYEIMGVGEYLIVGKDKALLIDTGYGFKDLASEVAKLAQGKDVLVVNSHVHPDHSLGNTQFEHVYVGEGDMGALGEPLLRQKAGMVGFIKKCLPPAGFVLNRLEKKKNVPSFETAYEKVLNGASFNLGDRAIEVMELPGHTPGSLIFLDPASKSIFAGDAINRGMFLYFDKALPLKEYSERLSRLAGLKGYDFIFSSHSTKPAPFEFIKYYADFLARVDLAKSKPAKMPLADEDTLRCSEKSREYGNVSVFFTRGQANA